MKEENEEEYCNDPACVACTIAKFENKLSQVAFKVDRRITKPQLDSAFKGIYNKNLAS